MVSIVECLRIGEMGFWIVLGFGFCVLVLFIIASMIARAIDDYTRRKKRRKKEHEKRGDVNG